MKTKIYLFKKMEYCKNLDLEDIKYFCEIDNCEKTEKWVPIPGFENEYNISDLGRIKSISRLVNCKHYKIAVEEKILNQSKDSGDYLAVSIRKNKKRLNKKVHSIVIMSFLGLEIKRGSGKVIDHKNNIPTDNRLVNLQVISIRENLTKDRNNSTGYTGIQKLSNTNKFIASIRKGKKSIYLGIYDTKEQASEAYEKALKEIINQ